MPSITDRKEEINQWKNNPSLTPTDFTIEFIQKFSSKKAKFEPHPLNSLDEKEREPQVEMIYGLFKHIAQYSNQNLCRNVTYLNSKLKKNINEMEWSVGSSNSKFDSKKFKLTCQFLDDGFIILFFETQIRIIYNFFFELSTDVFFTKCEKKKILSDCIDFILNFLKYCLKNIKISMFEKILSNHDCSSFPIKIINNKYKEFVKKKYAKTLYQQA